MSAPNLGLLLEELRAIRSELTRLRENTEPRSILMDAEEVACELGISVRTLQRLMQRRQIPEPVKIGAQLRWRRADLERFMLGAQQ